MPLSPQRFRHSDPWKQVATCAAAGDENSIGRGHESNDGSVSKSDADHVMRLVSETGNKTKRFGNLQKGGFPNKPISILGNAGSSS